ncbi:MAG: CPBP family intramembrane metalloprotease [Anaerolineae bacterium]|nr:CPBP family intramembrane metalloprotease [Anaerolineae bacterium]
MTHKPGIALWGMVVAGAVLFVIQTALADTDGLVMRFVLNIAVIAGAALAVMRLDRRGWRSVNGPPPEPVSLALVGLAALSVWAAAWWLMDWTNHVLENAAGTLPRPEPVVDLSDSIAGLDVQPVAYELEILFAVVLVPLAQAWLMWGLVQPALGSLVGRWRAAWLAGVVFGVFNTLTAVQNVTPALPWGLSSTGGYMLAGWVAALAVFLTGSPWTGFVAHGVFAYASFALADDLFHEMSGKDYLDVAWLTLVALGVFGAMIVLQAVRFRDPRPGEPERVPAKRLTILPLALLLAAVVVMAVLDIDARQDEEPIAAAVQIQTGLTGASERPPAAP